MHPYNDTKLTHKLFFREFSKKVDQGDLVWHKDKNNRNIRVVDGSGWYIQFENHIPRKLRVGESINIKAKTYHRILKENDCTNLVLEIEEM